MSLSRIVREAKNAIAEKWREAIYATYPFDTVGFLRTGQDEFKNPVGARTREAVDKLTGHLLDVTPLAEAELDEALDALIRVRAVQEFTPAKAMGAIFLVKGVVREIVKQHGKLKDDAADLLRFESKVDSVALRGFDIYVQCRAQLYEMRLKEVKNQHAMLLRRAQQLYETPVEAPETKKQ